MSQNPSVSIGSSMPWLAQEISVQYSDVNDIERRTAPLGVGAGHLSCSRYVFRPADSEHNESFAQPHNFER